MATYKKVADPLVSCPIVPVHRVLKSRLQMHITKCKRDNPTNEMKVCSINAQHIIPASDYMNHITNCPDRAIIDRQIYKQGNDQNIYRGTINVPTFHDAKPQQAATTVYWDEDLVSSTPTAGYNPKAKALNQNIIIDTAHWKPLDKRNHYKSLFAQNSTIPQDGDNIPPINPPPMVQVLKPPMTKADILNDVAPQSNRRRIAANFNGQAGGSGLNLTAKQLDKIKKNED